ncbi:MAG: AAA family ATPase [Candidatus Delongbacteria bacterium]|jgi:wobble nucleotide-excising tRNase
MKYKETTDYYAVQNNTDSFNMVSSRNKSIDLSISNIGPFYGSLSVRYDKLGQYRIAILARNGAGKTTISRMFNMFSNNAAGLSNNYLSIGEKVGNFRFKTDDDCCSIDISKDSNISITPPKSIIFHIFNSDYVSENVEQVKYVYSGNKEGYILGKGQIDVSEEKAEKEKKEKDRKQYGNTIRQMIDNSCKELKSLDVKENTNEMQQFEMSRILSGDKTDETDSYELLKNEYSKLKAMADLPNFRPVAPFDSDIFSGLVEIIEHSFKHSELGKEFTDIVKEDTEFYTRGVRLYRKDKSKCPFCNRSLSLDAVLLIEKYEAFVEDEESKIINRVKDYRKKIVTFSDTIVTNKAVVDLNYKSYEDGRRLFDSMINDSIQPRASFELLIPLLKQLEPHLERKENDVKYTGTVEQIIKEILDNVNDCNDFINNLNEKINLLKTNFRNKKNAQLEKKRRMCNAKFNQVIESCSDSISKYNALSNEISKLSTAIEEKENSIREGRRDKIVSSLKSYLNIFFNGKYILNEKEMTIAFNKGNETKADKILSEGEKTIVAFCYYLSSVHSIVNNVSDYKKIFFIIDDPISSLDYDHLYQVAGVIRNIPNYFNTEHSRYIILTHNADFFNLLTSQRIVTDAFHIHGDKANYVAEKIQILPYDHHLYDVLNVANKEQKPTHTIPNSIRHVLETIMLFEGSCNSLVTFIREKNEFKDDPAFYQLIEDLSHGRVRTGFGTTDEALIRSCMMVQLFVTNNYPGQIKTIKEEVEKGLL